MTQGKLSKAEKARATALANADALQSQAKVWSARRLPPHASFPQHQRSSVAASGMQGLEAEYDRLLAEYDELKRRLARSDPSFAASHRTGDKKSS